MMISENGLITFFTWLDVEEVFLREIQNEGWPPWLVSMRAYWDSLSLSVSPGQKGRALSWLAGKFYPRFDENNSRILLESDEDPRFFPVTIEETDEATSEARFIPSFSRPSVIRPLAPWRELEKETEYSKGYHERAKGGEIEINNSALCTSTQESPHVVVFHSFKGGVGRTVHALALSLALVERRKSRVLLIDGDLEAPGLTWLFSQEMTRPPISYMDFLALVHGDPDPEAFASIKLTANRLRNASVDGIYIMPAFRSMDRFSSLDIKPEHLVQFSKDPFVLTSLLQRLGKELGVNFVIVDLRAGLSEISASLLLDPRVYRILVTTLSGQSLHGTKLLLDLLAKDAPSRRSNEPLPSLIISQVPQYIRDEYETGNPEGELLRDLGFLQETASNLMKFSEENHKDDFMMADSDNLDQRDDYKEPLLTYSVTSFNDDLAVLPSSWDAAIRRIRKSRLDQTLIEILDWLPNPKESISWLVEKRRALADYAGGMIYAETGEVTDFLKIRPLNRLVSEFSTKVPIAIVMGAKGSGKTFTFLQLARARDWSKFAASNSRRKSIEAIVVPILKPKTLKDAANSIVAGAKINAARSLELSEPCTWEEISDDIRDQLLKDSHETKWRDNWLDYIAWSSGFEVMRRGAGRRFIDYLREKKTYLVAIVDGLENQFLDLVSDRQQQVAVRSLLQDVPNWLEQQVSRPLGILIFIRKDLVISALPQNISQFVAVYRNYELNWGSEEALRLFAWINMMSKSRAFLDDKTTDSLQDMTREELIQELNPLWGRKLGGEDSREAISANWVIYALSDYNGQIQARDVVRFLHLSAENSEGDSRWKDRILVPIAIRRSLLPCSQEKVKETMEENKELERIFGKIKKASTDKKQVPFREKDIGLDSKDLDILERNGVISRDGEEYYIPEIFRGGLGFGLRKGARPKVLARAIQAQRQRTNPI